MKSGSFSHEERRIDFIMLIQWTIFACNRSKSLWAAEDRAFKHWSLAIQYIPDTCGPTKGSNFRVVENQQHYSFHVPDIRHALRILQPGVQHAYLRFLLQTFHPFRYSPQRHCKIELLRLG